MLAVSAEAALAGRSDGRCELGEAEIQHLGVAALGHKDVGGLDVAVDDALGMSGVQSVGNLDGQREHGFAIERLSANEVLEGHAVEKFHGDERLIPVFADFVDGANIGMIESRGGARLAAKALERLRVLRQAIGQKFEGNEAAEFGVLGFVDHTHAATANLFDDAVVRDGLADQGEGLVFERIHLTDPAAASQRIEGDGRLRSAAVLWLDGARGILSRH